MKDISWMNHPAIKNIDPRKLAFITEFVNETEGKPVEKAIPVLVATNAKMKAMGLTFTQEESDLMTDILTRDISAADKKKIEMFKKMMANRK
jgi:hypothetical protein